MHQMQQRGPTIEAALLVHLPHGVCDVQERMSSISVPLDRIIKRKVVGQPVMRGTRKGFAMYGISATVLENLLISKALSRLTHTLVIK